jgi:hypothetical protein
MGIARAIRISLARPRARLDRMKRQAEQGGLSAVRSELGEGLRSRAVPAPLRGAARKLASLIDPSRPAKKAHHTPHAAPRTHAGSPEIDPGVARPPAEVTTTGVDSGAEPPEPLDGTPVDASTVGATPTYDATPIEVEPVDATPVAVSALEVTPLEVTPLEVQALEAEPLEAEALEAAPVAAEPTKPKPAAATAHAASERKPQPAQPRKPEKRPAASATAPSARAATKEKLAADHGAAKHLARSGSRAAKKRGSPSADTTSKKK